MQAWAPWEMQETEKEVAKKLHVRLQRTSGTWH